MQELKARHRDVMQDVLMDVLRALTSPNMDIRKKTLDIAMDLITSRNIDEVVMVLKKEVMKTQNKELDKGPEYRQLLVQAIHSCAVKFPDVAGNVIHLLMDFLGDTNTASALDVVFFVREIMETNRKLRASILERLLDSYNQIRSSRVCSCTLWIIGEYCDQKEDIYAALEVGLLGRYYLCTFLHSCWALNWSAHLFACCLLFCHSKTPFVRTCQNYPRGEHIKLAAVAAAAAAEHRVRYPLQIVAVLLVKHAVEVHAHACMRWLTH